MHRILPLLALASTAFAQNATNVTDTTNATLASNIPNFGYAKLLDLQKQFWGKFIYPNNIREAQSINSTVFAENVQGRVSDSRNFEGRELNTEYIFGLFIPSDSATVVGTPRDWEIVQFAANQNIAAATTRLNFTFEAFNNMTAPVVIDTWITWNEAGEITQYDAVFRWFGHLLQTLLGSVDQDPMAAAKKAAQTLATSVCNAHTSHCNGTNSQYASQDECMRFLTEEIRMGQSFELGRNTLLCRNMHEIMLKYRPDVHCPHVGRSGGGMCDDNTSYFQRVQEKYYTISPWIPEQF